MTHISSIRTPLSLDMTRELVDNALSDFFDTQIKKAHGIDAQYAALWNVIQTLSKSGGKRLRPYVTLLTYQAFSEEPVEHVVSVAAALEVLHLGMLVHDDIIDRDYIRYGISNISGQYAELYRSYLPDTNERRHFSDSAAMLAGDLLLLGGHDLILQSDVPDAAIRDISRIYNHAVFIVAGGELLDTESAFYPFDRVDALSIARAKTAHYSFVTPLVMGARLADVPESVCVQLESFGEKLGIAYQLVDDLLGVFGNEALTGKSALNDLREGKHTLLIEQFRKRASLFQKQEFDTLFGKKSLTEETAQILRNLLIDSGAKQDVDKLVDTYSAEASDILGSIDMPDIFKSHFESLLKTALKRQY
jgi:geranylgeranyl diphosphate synthase type II